jgi:hypothetical protein
MNRMDRLKSASFKLNLGSYIMTAKPCRFSQRRSWRSLARHLADRLLATIVLVVSIGAADALGLTVAQVSPIRPWLVPTALPSVHPLSRRSDDAAASTVPQLLPVVGRSVRHAARAGELMRHPHGFGGTVSGLPWASGAIGGIPQFGDWRGRPLDIYTMFTPFTWEGVVDLPRWATTRRLAALPGRLSIGLSMLSSDQRWDFTPCVTGQNDAHLRSFVRGLVAIGAGDAILRVGWEMNGGSFHWSLGRIPASIPLYRQCFVRMATIIRSEAPNMLIEWPPRRETMMPLRLETLYPGDEYVDIIGVLYYDWWPASPTEASWNANLVQRDRLGGPKGLQTWLTFAQDHGKPLSLPEWGLGKHGELDPFDNPLFIQKMFEFFARNASDIAYESYFNRRTHRLTASSGLSADLNLRSAEMYRRLYAR